VGAGTVQVPNERAEAVLAELISRLREPPAAP